MRLSLRSTRPGIARDGGSVYVEVNLDPEDDHGLKQGPGSARGPDRAGQAGRPVRHHPVAVCLVFDRSGSMAGPASPLDRDRGGGSTPYGYGRSYRPAPPGPGHLPPYGQTKMDYVKQAAHILVDELGDGDCVALVSFSHTGRVEVPMTQVNAWSRNMLHNAIESFHPEDSTNLHEGMVLGEREFGSALPATHNCKMVLLSDGLANVGVTSPGGMADFALSAHRRGITVSVLGVGLDYSAEIMGTLAQCGGGRFHHIADARYLPEIIVSEMVSAALVHARRVSLEVGAGPLVAVGANLNLYHQQACPNGTRIDIGDLVGSRSVVFEVSTLGGPAGFVPPPAADRTAAEAIVKVTCRWEDENKADREATATLALPVVDPKDAEALPVDAELVEQVARLLEARTTRLASGAYDMGDHVRTQALVSAGLGELARLTTGRPEADRRVAEARSRLADLAGRFERQDVATDEVKNMYGSAFDATAGPVAGDSPGGGAGPVAGDSPGGGAGPVAGDSPPAGAGPASEERRPSGHDRRARGRGRDGNVTKPQRSRHRDVTSGI